MSFYTLDMEADIEPTKVLALLAEHLPFRWQQGGTSSSSEEYRHLVGEHTIVYASAHDNSSQWFQEYFGFTPNLYVSLEIYMTLEEAHRKAVRIVMRCVTLLLEHLRGDAVLTEYHEVLVLKRLDGQLILSAKAFDDSYHQQALAEITLPYEMQELPYRI